MIDSAFSKYFEEIESGILFSRLALSNNVDTFLRIIKSESSILMFKGELSLNPDLAGQVINRIETLIEIESNLDSLHKYDYAIAIYLYVLAEANAKEFIKIWTLIKEKRLPNLWWTYGVGHDIIHRDSGTLDEDPKAAFDIPGEKKYDLEDRSITSGSSKLDDESKENRYRESGGTYA